MTEYSLTLAKATSAALGLSKSVAIDVALVQPYTVFSLENVESGPVVIAPVADFVGSAVSGNAPLTVNFTDLSTNSPTSWAWDFGDATTSTSQNPTKIYTVPGVYTVTLVATNAAGSDTEIKASYIVAAFNPASLFTGGYQGGWYDPSDLSTLWQDSARTTPVTTDGQPVGCIDDKSGNGNNLTQATASFRPQYKTSGGLHWLEFDGVNDVLVNIAFTMNHATYTAMQARTDNRTAGTFLSSMSGNKGFSHERNGTTSMRFYHGTGAGYTSSILTSVANGVANVTSSGYDGTNFNQRIGLNSMTSVVGTYAPQTVAGLNVGYSGYSIGTTRALGRLHQCLYINRYLDSTEQLDTVTFFNTKAGL